MGTSSSPSMARVTRYSVGANVSISDSTQQKNIFLHSINIFFEFRNGLHSIKLQHLPMCSLGRS